MSMSKTKTTHTINQFLCLEQLITQTFQVSLGELLHFHPLSHQLIVPLVPILSIFKLVEEASLSLGGRISWGLPAVLVPVLLTSGQRGRVAGGCGQCLFVATLRDGETKKQSEGEREIDRERIHSIVLK